MLTRKRIKEVLTGRNNLDTKLELLTKLFAQSAVAIIEAQMDKHIEEGDFRTNKSIKGHRNIITWAKLPKYQEVVDYLFGELRGKHALEDTEVYDLIDNQGNAFTKFLNYRGIKGTKLSDLYELRKKATNVEYSSEVTNRIQRLLKQYYKRGVDVTLTLETFMGLTYVTREGKGDEYAY